MPTKKLFSDLPPATGFKWGQYRRIKKPSKGVYNRPLCERCFKIIVRNVQSTRLCEDCMEMP